MTDWPTILHHLGTATIETIYVVLASGLLAGLMGLGLGILLFSLNCRQLCAHKAMYHALAMIINTLRSIPFIIFMIAVIPLTRLLVGSAIGTTASIVPLTLAATPMLARMVEHTLHALPASLLEAATALGATRKQMIWYFLLPEAKNQLIRHYTTALVTLTGYASMCGAIGGGGLGDYAIRYGYQRFDPLSMLGAIVIIWAIVQGIEVLGHFLTRLQTTGE